MESNDKQPIITGVKPVQSLSYSEKISKDNEWGRENVRYFIDAANFNYGTGTRLHNMQTWYNAYNNRIDDSIFNYVTNPLDTKNELYKSFPAKLRSYNILRPSIDLLIGEYSKKPFKFDVVNTDGDDVYNSKQAAEYKVFSDNLKQRFINETAKGQPTTNPPVKDLPDPQTVIEDLNTNYKDLKAIKGYKSLKVLEQQLKLKEKFKDQFKDWLLAGEVTSLKFAKRDDIEYDRLSPVWADWDKSPLVKNIEDGSHAVVKFRVTVADLVDMFYDELKEKHLKKLEEDENAYKRRLFFTFSGDPNDTTDQNKERINKCNLFYVCWKSRKKIGFLEYNDPMTLERLTMVVDEDYPVDKDAGEEIEWIWVNEAWEGWRINDDLYLGIQPIIAQRNELNNFSECKLSVNGRRFSDTESANISLMALGMSYQIMYIIMMYRMELCIAKSKGKILLIDKNIVPDGEVGEEKWLYYAEGLGYSFVDFNQDGVNNAVSTKWQVLDMSLYNDIAQLIKIAQFYKDSWEELLGINRQRKGETNSSDGLGVTEEAVFRSSIISDIIFSTFDEYVESELQGLLDLTRFAWVDGKKAYYRSDDGRMEMLALDKDEATNASMGVFVDSTGRMQEKFKMLQAQVNMAVQRKDIKMSTVADLIFTESYAELKAKLKEAEALEVAIAQKVAENEQVGKEQMEQIKKDYAEFEKQLSDDSMQQEQDRLDNRVYIEGEVAAATAAAGVTSTPIDINGIQDSANKRLEVLTKQSLEREKLQQTERIAKMKDKREGEKIKASLVNKVVGEK